MYFWKWRDLPPEHGVPQADFTGRFVAVAIS
jgi:hypothetical protein